MPVDFREFAGLGTTWKIYLADSIPDDTKAAAYAFAELDVQTFDNDYSRFKDNSWVGRLNLNGQLENPPEELVDMLRYALDCARITDNHFNIAAGSRLEDIGYDKNYSFKKKDFRKIKNLEEVLKFDKNSVTLDIPASIDLGGLGKGWLIDKIAEDFRSRGLKSFIIDGGGDIFIQGAALKDNAIHLEDPFSDGSVIGEIHLEDGAVASSSPKRRSWPDIKDGGTLHHLVNPKSRQTITSVAAVYTHSVESATAADTASTCLFVSPSSLHEAIAKHFTVSYCIVYADGSFYATANYPGKIFTNC